MTLYGLAVRNLARSKLRAAMTILAMAICVVSFIALRTVLDAWGLASQFAAKDRLSTRHKVSFVSPLPKRYVADIAEHVPGVRAVTHCDWFGARWPKAPGVFFANMACAANAFDLFPEIAVAPAALARFKSDKRAAIVGDLLAKQLALQVGDQMTLESSFYPGDFRVTIVGVYSAPPRSAVDRSTLFFRWDYKNDAMPAARRDMVGWVFTRVDDAGQSAAVSRAIDALFDERDPRTLTMSERAANQATLGAVSSLLRAIDVISLIVLLIMLLILGNTSAMNVRERIPEYGVLRALGFTPAAVRRLVLSEACALSTTAGALGLALSYPLVELALGRWLEENMGQFFPAFRITAATALSALGACVFLGLAAAALPAWRAEKVSVSEAVRRLI